MDKVWQAIYVWITSWAERFYPGWKRWVFFTLVVSFGYLSLSGLFFFLFIRRGLFGLLLLLHVGAGGAFAICLSLVLIWRARFYFFEREQPMGLKLFFWIYAGSGFFLVITALGSMLSFLSLPFQTGLMGWHRFCAFLSLAAASFFVRVTLKRDV